MESPGGPEAYGSSHNGIRQRIREGASLSGHERDRVFFQGEDHSFVDLSPVTGLDLPGDGRSFAFLDVNRDGRRDVAVVSANAPLLQVLQNNMPGTGGSIAVRLEGGNHGGAPNPEWTNRDGVGARIVVSTGERDQLRELQAGEGLAAQNSETLLVGLGTAAVADRVLVRWPSGRTQSVEDVPAGSEVFFQERLGATVLTGER